MSTDLITCTCGSNDVVVKRNGHECIRCKRWWMTDADIEADDARERARAQDPLTYNYANYRAACMARRQQEQA
jgi:hypothetical protein